MDTKGQADMRKKFICTRCGYEWASRSVQTSEKYREPKTCARKTCKSPYWNKPRIRNLKQHVEVNQ